MVVVVGWLWQRLGDYGSGWMIMAVVVGLWQWLDDGGNGWMIIAVAGGLWQWLEEGWRKPALGGWGPPASSRCSIDMRLLSNPAWSPQNNSDSSASKSQLHPITAPSRFVLFLHVCAQAQKENPLLAVTMRGQPVGLAYNYICTKSVQCFNAGSVYNFMPLVF